MRTKVVFNTQIMKLMKLFEKITSTKVKDCIPTDYHTIFIVPTGLGGKAIGKKGVNAKRLMKLTNRKIKIVEFNSNILTFIKNLLFPLKVKEISESPNKIININSIDSKTRGYIIGKNAQNLRLIESIVKRYFDIEEIKVN